MPSSSSLASTISPFRYVGELPANWIRHILSKREGKQRSTPSNNKMPTIRLHDVVVVALCLFGFLLSSPAEAVKLQAAERINCHIVAHTHDVIYSCAFSCTILKHVFRTLDGSRLWTSTSWVPTTQFKRLACSISWIQLFWRCKQTLRGSLST